ncbi:MAG: cache domain-containing protein [Proteobacteria bacterium]|nr:cache domain-containing protein [Pseudomonadota bacterium]
MRLRTKVILLSVLPLLAALALIAVVIVVQQAALARREQQLVQGAYMDARRGELRHYVDLAMSTVRPIYDERDGAPGRRNEALRRLGALDYGPDGYFFVYDLDGTVLMHSRQPELVGRNLLNLRDTDGEPIRRLIDQARAGGGYVAYEWRKPSNGQLAAKLGYVIALERWHWMVGTGLYLDDIGQTLRRVDEDARRNIGATIAWIAGIALLGIVLISAGGLTLNVSEHRVADARLRLMARQVVQSQEAERAHLARELHDGTSQTLVSAKLLIESALEEGRAGRMPAAALESALARLNDALGEVRGISHRLRPALLDTLGLPAALHHLATEVGDASGMAIAAPVRGTASVLPDVVVTVLFRIAQEALTNCVKHARAARVELALVYGADGGVRLDITDDGAGFDLAAVQRDPHRGLGLRSMRERLAAVGGRLEIETSPGHGVQLRAIVAAAALARMHGLDAADHATSPAAASMKEASA